MLSAAALAGSLPVLVLCWLAASAMLSVLLGRAIRLRNRQVAGAAPAGRSRTRSAGVAALAARCRS